MFKTLTIPEFETQFSNLETYELASLLDAEMNDDIFKLLYIISEYSISNFKGTVEFKRTQEELRQYLDQIIPLGPERKSECLGKAASLQGPDFVLDVNVIEGSGLKFKNLSGELFCKMWMKSDTKVAKFTKAVNLDRNPIWNANDFLPLKNLDDRVLFIEIHRKQKNSLSKDNAKGAGNGIREKMSEVIPESNGKLKGIGKIKTIDIHSEGSDIWIPIKSPKNGNLKGHLHVEAILKVSRDYCGLNALKRHLLLIKLCVQMHIGDSEEIITCWDSISTSVLLGLVFLHYTMENIPVCETNICWFAVVNHLVIKGKKVSFQFRYRLLHKCVKELRKCSKSNCNVEQSLKDMFVKQFEVLKKDCLTFIENLHSYDLGGDKYKRQDFEYALKTILFSKPVLGKYCDSFIILKSDAQKWYDKITEEISVCEDILKYFTETLEHQKEFQVSADKVLGKAFPEKTYTSVIFDHIDKFINETLKRGIKDLKHVSFDSEEDFEEQMSSTLKVFEVSKILIHYIYKASNEFQLKFSEMREWFGIEVIENWFDWKKQVAVRQIKMALCFDDAMQLNSISFVSRREKFSSSVKVVQGIIQNCLTDLWDLVSISGSSSRYDALFINALHECCTVFVSGLTERNSPKNTIEDSHKTAKKRICVLANDMHAMSMFIDRTVYGTVEAQCDDLPKTEDFLLDWCCKLCTQIRRMHESVINKRVKKMSKSRSKLTQSLEIKKYTEFIETVVWKEARRYMTLDVLITFLKEIWSYTLVFIEKTAFNREEVPMSGHEQLSKCQCNFKGLLQILKETEKLCSVDDRANFTKFLWNDEVKSLQKKLKDASKTVKQ